jgi:dCTP deaminase
MAVLGKSELRKLIQGYKAINPFDPQLLDGDSYLLTVKEGKTLLYQQHVNLLSREIVFTPPNCVAHLTAKSEYGRKGLSFLNASKVHSGFVGRLVLETVNLNNERRPIVIEKDTSLTHIEFMDRRGDPSPYDGPFQFQHMTNSEVEMYTGIINKSFKNDFDRETLKRQVRNRI